MSIINTAVQPFKVQAFKNGEFIEVTEQSLKGKWSTFIFMPAAFTFNCPTEVEDAADNYAKLKPFAVLSYASENSDAYLDANPGNAKLRAIEVPATYRT